MIKEYREMNASVYLPIYQLYKFCYLKWYGKTQKSLFSIKLICLTHISMGHSCEISEDSLNIKDVDISKWYFARFPFKMNIGWIIFIAMGLCLSHWISHTHLYCLQLLIFIFSPVNCCLDRGSPITFNILLCFNVFATNPRLIFFCNPQLDVFVSVEAFAFPGWLHIKVIYQTKTQNDFQPISEWTKDPSRT